MADIPAISAFALAVPDGSPGSAFPLFEWPLDDGQKSECLADEVGFWRAHLPPPMPKAMCWDVVVSGFGSRAASIASEN